MRKKEKSQEVRTVFPSREEIRAAQLACCGRCCNQCESPAEYAWRKRDVDMAILLEKAIENELTERQRLMIGLYYFKGMNIPKIAEMLGVNRSTVSRTISRGRRSILEKMKFFV